MCAILIVIYLRIGFEWIISFHNPSSPFSVLFECSIMHGYGSSCKCYFQWWWLSFLGKSDDYILCPTFLPLLVQFWWIKYDAIQISQLAIRLFSCYCTCTNMYTFIHHEWSISMKNSHSHLYVPWSMITWYMVSYEMHTHLQVFFLPEDKIIVLQRFFQFV